MVITEIEKTNKLIIPKRLVKMLWGDVKIVGIEKTENGLELSKIK